MKSLLSSGLINQKMTTIRIQTMEKGKLQQAVRVETVSWLRRVEPVTPSQVKILTTTIFREVEGARCFNAKVL